MFDVAEIIQLKDGERVQTLVRKHRSTILPSLVLAGALLVVPFFFLFTFVRLGSIGMLIFALFIAVGLFVTLKTFFIWDASVLLVTNQRLVQVDQRSLWNRFVSEIALVHVRDLQWEKRGMRDTLTHTGALRIKTGSSSVPDIIVKHIPRPEEVLRLIQELRDHHLASAPGAHPQGSLPAERLLDMETRKRRLHAAVDAADVQTLERFERECKS